MNRSTCNTCSRLVPAEATERDGRIFLVKACPECGTSETLISGDAERYHNKRRFDEPFDYQGCLLQCVGCAHKKPNIVFVDITNRCNLNCPICINNTPSMGFLFEPPLEYFDKIFRHYAAFDAKPSIQLFGGEPTVREDLFEIIRMARSYGLPTRVVTNGLKLADEDYCRRLIESKATILLAYDGENPELYRVLRHSEKSLDLKRKALDNIQRIGGAKVTLMCLAAKGFNDRELPRLFQFCHDRRDTIRAVYFMPLAHTWNAEKLELEPERITGEDIEGIIHDTFAGDPVEFLPAAFLGQIPTLVKYLKIKPLPFAGAHPNCESMYLLVSDGEKYVPLSHFLKSPVGEFGQALLDAEARLARVARDSVADSIRRGAAGHAEEKSGPRGASSKPTFREKLLKLRANLALASILLRHGRPSRLLKGRGLAKLWHGLALPFGLAFARKTRYVLERHTNVGGVLQVVVLPFEDKFALETDRLERCPSGFAFWDPRDGQVKNVPVCAWGRHKVPVMKLIQEHYAKQPAEQEATLAAR